jgi:predicted RNA-binding protein YlxR (DUF448 family)/ribosomal protein L30E
MPKVEPQRSCLGCRETKDKRELLRFVLAPDASVVPDPQNKLPGRGAYTCYRRDCLIAAVGKRQFARAFKGEAKTGSAEAMVESLRVLLLERIASYISLANKAGKVISGSDKILDGFRKGTPELLVLATDISPDSAEKFIAVARKAGVETHYVLTKDRLGALLGKDLRSAAAIVQSGFVATLRLELTRYRNFFEGGAW